MYSVDFTDVELQTLLEVMVDHGTYLDSLDDEDEDYLETFDAIFKKLVDLNEVNDVLF
jgi:hypothetical protein